MRYISSLFFLLLHIGNAFGHNSDNDHHPSYSFKDRIHGMCAGHHHLDDIELKEICNHFSEHFPEILKLQAEPHEFRPERYLNNLTALVIFSDTLTKEQKHDFYRRSYDQAIAARKNGEEWKWLLGLLVERTDALSLSELQDLMKNTTHEQMKPLIEKAMDRIERRSSIRNRPDEDESDKHAGLKAPDTEQHSSLDKDHTRFYWFILGLVLLGIIMLLLKALKGKTTL